MSIAITISTQSAGKLQEQRQEVDLPATVQVAIQRPDKPLQIIAIGIDEDGNTVKRVEVEMAPLSFPVPQLADDDEGEPE